MGGFLPDAGLEYSAATAVCHVVRDGVFLTLRCAECGGGEAHRSETGRPESEWTAEDLLHHVGPSGEVLREHPARVRNRVTSTGVQAGDHTRGTGPQERAGQDPQRQHQWTTRAQT